MGLRAAVALGLMLAATASHAQLLDSVVMPGKVIEGHAKIETDCGTCHVPFDKAGQTRLCLHCHKPVAADVRERRGYHGRAPEVAGKECRACHSDHLGRDARIVRFDARAFDHAITGYALRGAHARAPVGCTSCHAPGRKYRDASPECRACHAKDDRHKGSLGGACGDCHTDRSWKEALFDHSRTRFALEARHARVQCDACHKRPDYKEAPRNCQGCHRGDDAHKGRYGDKCESCHDTAGWKSRFRHDAQTRFPLNGKHGALKCSSCHKGDLYRDKVATTCVGCHRADDTHRGALGDECGRCHGEASWKATRFDHDATRFALKGRHRSAKCADCHLPGSDRRVGSECISCHRKDDAHRAQEGEACGGCHDAASWRVARYDHSQSRFPLTGAHYRIECKSCHASLRFRDAQRDCASCHAKDDRHRGALGPKCADCHTTRAWMSVDFDHDRRTDFALEGRHRAARCADCHSKPAMGKVTAARACVGCHAGEDTHGGGFGTRCERCHTSESWKHLRPGMGAPPGR
ncbi:MAG: cytochrome C [Usitatibacter sp.]